MNYDVIIFVRTVDDDVPLPREAAELVDGTWVVGVSRTGEGGSLRMSLDVAVHRLLIEQGIRLAPVGERCGLVVDEGMVCHE